MNDAAKKECLLTDPEPFRQWLLMYYKMFNLQEIEYHCELQAKAIYKDLAGTTRMTNKEWFCVCNELHAVFSTMPSTAIHP